MSRGLRTTEFWITLLTSVGLVTAALAQALPAKWAAVAVAATNGLYTIARGLAKVGTTPTPVVAVTPVLPESTTAGKGDGGS